jgi:hypothetical protein
MTSRPATACPWRQSPAMAPLLCLSLLIPFGGTSLAQEVCLDRDRDTFEDGPLCATERDC